MHVVGRPSPLSLWQVEAEERRTAELLTHALRMNVDEEARKPVLVDEDVVWDMRADAQPGTPASFVSPVPRSFESASPVTPRQMHSHASAHAQGITCESEACCCLSGFAWILCA